MQYFYKARNAAGDLTQGGVDAESREEAVQKILRSGLVPVEVDVQHGHIKKMGTVAGLAGHVKLDDLGDFLQRFSDLIVADIPLVRALQMVEKRTRRIELREALGRLISKVQDGIALSSAVASEGKIFPSYWPGLIRAGEISGKLKDILERLSHLVEKERETRSRLIGAAIYPLLILGFGFLLVIGLLLFLVPPLERVFADIGQTLPLATRILITISRIVSNTWWIFILAGIAVYIWIKSIAATASGRLAMERIFFRIPFWGEFIKTDDMERLARTVGILLQNGVETVTALECGIQTLRRETVKKEMVKTVTAVRGGVGLSAAFATTPLFSEDVVSMISIGEESGRGYQGFLQWADISDRRLERMSKTVTALLEPVLIFILAAVLGSIVLALLFPILTMNFGG